MTTCPACGAVIFGPDDAGMCRWHGMAASDTWAKSNRMLCDFFHRGTPLPRLPASEREEEPEHYGGAFA